MPTVTDKLRLQSDTTIMTNRSALFQCQQCQCLVIDYHSKKLPQEVCTDLELTSLVCEIHCFSQLLKHYYFEVQVDHKSIENV